MRSARKHAHGSSSLLWALRCLLLTSLALAQPVSNSTHPVADGTTAAGARLDSPPWTCSAWDDGYPRRRLRALDRFERLFLAIWVRRAAQELLRLANEPRPAGPMAVMLSYDLSSSFNARPDGGPYVYFWFASMRPWNVRDEMAAASADDAAGNRGLGDSLFGRVLRGDHFTECSDGVVELGRVKYGDVARVVIDQDSGARPYAVWSPPEEVAVELSRTVARWTNAWLGSRLQEEVQRRLARIRANATSSTSPRSTVDALGRTPIGSQPGP